MHPKNFRIQMYAYQLYADFVVNSIDSPLDIENAIVDKLGKGDIKWESLGEMHDPRVNRITYEEVIEDGKTSAGPLSTEEGSGPRMGAGSSQGG